MSERKFYVTEVKIRVLSEDEPWEGDLSDLSYDITEGHFVGYDFGTQISQVSAEEMALSLVEAGSDPGFFDLDEAGN
jgi:hypothetical protein